VRLVGDSQLVRHRYTSHGNSLPALAGPAARPRPSARVLELGRGNRYRLGMAVETGALSLAEIRAAAERIREYVLPTPTVSGEAVAGAGAWFKAENLQRTGSFKVRGAINAVLQLDSEQRRRGVITVIVPVGGGGLIAGAAVAIKQQRPGVRIIGIEPERAPTVSESLAAGHPVPPSRLDTIADGLAAPYTRPFNLALIQRYVDEVRTVSDEAIIAALRSIVLQAKLVVEPAGAAGVAALASDAAIQRPVVIVLTGG